MHHEAHEPELHYPIRMGEAESSWAVRCQAQAATGGGGAEQPARGVWLRLRIRLLQQRERLGTLLALHDGWATQGPIAQNVSAQMPLLGKTEAMRHHVGLLPPHMAHIIVGIVTSPCAWKVWGLA